MKQIQKEREEKERMNLEMVQKQNEIVEKKQAMIISANKKIAELAPLLTEANLCSKQFRRPYEFSYKLI